MPFKSPLLGDLGGLNTIIMKKIILAATLLFATVALSAQHKLTIQVDGIEKMKGRLFVALYDEANFMKKPVYWKIAKVDTQEMTVTIDSVAAGSYAVSMFQDVNDNNKLDMGSFGPSEPWAFSNNAKGQYGPPAFKDCLFKMDEDVTIYITLQ